MNALAAQRSSPGRPRSMMVDEGGVKYTTITFAQESHGALPPQRRNTKYSNIMHQPIPIKDNSKDGASSLAVDQSDGEPSPSSPSYVSVGVCSLVQHKDDESAHFEKADNTLYDVPPPPVPIRFDGVAAPKTTPDSGPDDPFSRDPFTDPFAGGDSWNDPTAFYDKPRSRNSVKVIDDKVQEDGYFEIGKTVTTLSSVNSSDFTGESSYEDTSAFLQDIRSQYKDRHEDEIKAAHSKSHKKLNDDIVEDDDVTSYELPPVEYSKNLEVSTSQAQEEDVVLGSYDFPSALTRYPFKEGGDGKSSSREEPTLHTMQYPIQKLPLLSGGGGGKSESARGSRHHVPLPPTPLEHDLKDGHPPGDPPPLPARQVSQGTKAPARDGPLPPVPQAGVDRPPLPPMNHPWGNKRTVNANQQSTCPLPPDHQHPPLPPRRKPGNANGHGGDGGNLTTPSPPLQPSEDPILAEMMSKGYQLADIQRALRIAKGNFELTKSILKEFGGRH